MKICIIRADRMGDMVLTLPIIQSIKKLNTSYKITVFCSNKNVKIIKDYKFIDKIFNLNDKYLIRKEKYDLILNFTPGWRYIFICLFTKSSNKANLIFTSRYKKNYFSKFWMYLFSKIFFQKTILINRIKRFNNNESIHQTNIMFELLEKCKVEFNKNTIVEPFLKKNKKIISTKNICLIHLSSKWLNTYYSETDLLELISKLDNKYNLVLTSDETTKKKFPLIYRNFALIGNNNFKNFTNLSKTTIFDKFNFENWTQLIYLSSLVITPECGCTHIASLCQIPSKIIYDPNNKPKMIHAEYAPWKSNHEYFTFDSENLNLLLTQKL